MDITEFTVQKLKDPTGIITGDRYEFHIYIMLDEEDELYTEGGVGIRAIYAVDENGERVVMSAFFKRETNEALEFELEEEEVEAVAAFCKLNYQEN